MSNSSLDIDDIVANLKATITSFKGGVLLNDIESDYANIVGEPLPYQKLGFSSLIEFIQTIKEFKIEKQGCNTIVSVLSNSKNKHLQDMIKRQKNTKKCKSRKVFKITNKKTNSIHNSSGKYNKQKLMSYDLNIYNKTKKDSVDLINSKWLKNCEIEEIKNRHNTTICTTKNTKNNIMKNNTNSTENKKCYTNKNNNTRQTVVVPNTSLKISAQDRLKKYVKKDSCPFENHKSNNVYDQVLQFNLNISKPIDSNHFKVHINKKQMPGNQPIILSTCSTNEFNYKINQLTIEYKSKRIVTVTAVNSSSEVWILLNDIDDNHNFMEMQTELNKMMKLDDRIPINDPIIVGHYYTLYHQEKWHRIVITHFDRDLIQCFFIDIGISMYVKQNEIYPLKPQFFNICGQAVKIVLYKLKSFDEFLSTKDLIINNLLNKRFILIPSSVITYPCVGTLYDMDTKMNVNDLLLNMFFQNSSPFSLFKNGTGNVAEVLSIVDGYWYLQFNKDLVKSMEKCFSLPQFSEPFSSANNIKTINLKLVYLAEYKTNTKGRVKVVNFLDNFLVKIFFIDYGTYDVIDVKELIELHKIDPLIAKIPCQAVKIMLHMFPPNEVTNNTVDVFFKILKNNTQVTVFLLKIVENVPCVQLWSDLYPSTYINMILFTR